MFRESLLLLVILSCIAYATSVPTGETDCQRRRREQSSTGNHTGLLIPECDEHGHYLSIQCFGEAVDGSRFCACYDKDFGQIKAPSKKVKSCNCIRKHHDWHQQNGTERENEPRCNTTTGEFQPVQCTSTHHWCVNTHTGEHLGREMSGGCGIDLSFITCGVDGTHHGHTEHEGSAHNDSSSQHGTDSRHEPNTDHSGQSASSEDDHHGDHTSGSDA